MEIQQEIDTVLATIQRLYRQRKTFDTGSISDRTAQWKIDRSDTSERIRLSQLYTMLAEDDLK